MSIFKNSVFVHGHEKRVPDLGHDWNDRLEEIFSDERYWGKDGLCDLLEKIDDSANGFKDTICPNPNEIFRCFKETSFDSVRCVLLGNDPYPDPKYADGLSFSIGKLQKNKWKAGNGKALKVLLKERWRDEKAEKNIKKLKKASGGDLSSWASNGVLLLNRVLIVKREKKLNEDNEYSDKWEWFIQMVVKYIAANVSRCAFIFFGETWEDFLYGKNGQAGEKEELECRGKNMVILYRHPSAGRCNNVHLKKFKDDHVYSKILKFLHNKIIYYEVDYDELFPMPT